MKNHHKHLSIKLFCNYNCNCWPLPVLAQAIPRTSHDSYLSWNWNQNSLVLAMVMSKTRRIVTMDAFPAIRAKPREFVERGC